MKLLKLSTMLGIVVCAIIGLMLVLDIGSNAEAIETLKKALMVIGIITITSGALFLVSGKK